MMNAGVEVDPGRMAGRVAGMSVGIGVGPGGKLRGAAQAARNRIGLSSRNGRIRNLITSLLM